MKVYIVHWGYHSCDNSEPVVEAIYSTFEKALDHIKASKTHSFKKLTQSKHRKTGELLNSWSDGDYFTYINEGYVDSPALYMSKEEYEAL